MTDDYLMHHGIKGQKWGVRRFQEPNGALTEAGRKRYGIKAQEFKKKAMEDAKKLKNKTGEFVKKKVQDVIGKEKRDDLSSLSDQELRDRVNRLRTEADYHRLKSELEAKPVKNNNNNGNNGGGGKKQRDIKKTVAYTILAAPLITVLATQARKQYGIKVEQMIDKHKAVKMAQAAKELGREANRTAISAEGKELKKAFEHFFSNRRSASLDILDLKHEDPD